MDKNWNGKEIIEVHWPDKSPLIANEENGRLFFSVTYHGTRDQFWVIQEKCNKEVARHNADFIESIIWKL